VNQFNVFILSAHFDLFCLIYQKDKSKMDKIGLVN